MTISFGQFGYRLGQPQSGSSEVRDVAPASTAAPAISGPPMVGQQLATSNGSWSGSLAPTFTYQWYRGTTAISVATSRTYTPVTADRGTSLACEVTATNRAGTAARR